MTKPSSARPSFKQWVKQAANDKGIIDPAKRFLNSVWSQSQWLIYLHTLDTGPDACPGDSLSLEELIQTNTSLIGELARQRKIGQAGYDEKRFARKLLKSLKSGDRCFVASHEGQVAGWVRLSAIDSDIWNSGIPLTPASKEVKDLYIAQKFRGTGFIAYYLLIGVMQEAKTSGVPMLISVINPGNTPSVRINTRVGFKPMGTLNRKTRFFRRKSYFRKEG